MCVKGGDYMQYKPAYIMVADMEKFIGNYDSLSDLRYEYRAPIFECVDKGDRLILCVLTVKEFEDCKHEFQNIMLFSAA